MLQDEQKILFAEGKTMGTRKYIVTLISEEHKRLTWLVSSAQDKAYRMKHANIPLAADEDGPNLTSQGITKAFPCHLNAVSGICQRFVKQGLETALARKKRQEPPALVNLAGEVKLNSLLWHVESRRKAQFVLVWKMSLTFLKGHTIHGIRWFLWMSSLYN